MALLTNSNAATTAGNMIGKNVYIYAITTGTISVEDAVTAITTTYFGTIVGISGTAGGTEYVAVEGGAGGAEAVSGIALTTSFTH